MNHPDEHQRVLMRYLALSLCITLNACQPAPSEPFVSSSSSNALVTPASVQRLRQLDASSVQLTLSINNEIFSESPIAEATSTQLQIPVSRFDQAINRVQVEFEFVASDQRRWPLAGATQSVPMPSASDDIVLSGLQYIYTDSDGDGLANVHEVLASTPDQDNDGLTSPEDTDSDDDGISDGQDVSPFDVKTSDQASNGLRPLTLRTIDGTLQTIDVAITHGHSAELDILLLEVGQVLLTTSIEWPGSVTDLTRLQMPWVAFGLGRGPLGLCNHWRIAIDTSSLQSRMQYPALLLFNRIDGPAFVAPLGSATIDNLQGFELPDGVESTSTRVWNDALQAILVPQGQTGWFDLWTAQGLSGDVCSVNVSAAP